MENSKLDGSPDWDKITRALMKHRNTPDTEFCLSPAQFTMGLSLSIRAPPRKIWNLVLPHSQKVVKWTQKGAQKISAQFVQISERRS